MSLEGYDREVGIIYDYLGDDFPMALMQPAELDCDDELRLRSAGLGLADVREGEEVLQATYVRDPGHPAVIALQGIAAAETRGDIAAGSHDQAIDCLVLGIPGPLDEFTSRHIV